MIEHTLSNVAKLQPGVSGQTTQQTSIEDVDQLNQQVLQSIEELHRGFLYQLQFADKDRLFPGIITLVKGSQFTNKDDDDMIWYFTILCWKSFRYGCNFF
jgi:hypothetical protein